MPCRMYSATGRPMSDEAVVYAASDSGVVLVSAEASPLS